MVCVDGVCVWVSVDGVGGSVDGVCVYMWGCGWVWVWGGGMVHERN